MAVVQNIVFLVNGHSLADAINGFTFSGAVEEKDATTVDNSGFQSFVPAFRTGDVQISGIFDSDGTNLDKIHDIFNSAFTSGEAKNVIASNGIVSVGANALMIDGSMMQYDIPHDVGELIFVNGNFRANSGIKFGKWLLNAQLNAGTTNGTSLDNTASSTSGGFFQVHLDNSGGVPATDVDVRLQHSIDDAIWADVSGGAINNLSAAHTSGSVSVTGTINRYTRAVAVVTGGNTVLVSAAFARA